MTTRTTFPEIAATDTPIDVIIKLSNFYGGDPMMTLAGGGNTSVKKDGVLHVKASGFSLATIGAEGFVALDRSKLDKVAESDYGTDREVREEAYKQGILDARTEPEKGQRPSVEALVHHLVPGTYVVHSHSTVTNVLTCFEGGEALAKELFGDAIVWVPFVDPGYTLAKEIRDRLAAWEQSGGDGLPLAILMENHGLIVSGESAEEIKEKTDRVVGAISDRLGSATWWGNAAGADDAATVRVIGPALRGLCATPGINAKLPVVTFSDDPAVMAFVGDVQGRADVAAGPLTPDQIVYCNSHPLWFDHDAEADEADEAATVESLRAALAGHRETTGFDAKIVLVQGLGLFAIGDDYKGAATTRDVYIDAIRIMLGARQLGGISHLSDDHRKFIEDWEVEAYRKKIAAAAAAKGRVAGKVAIVTGAAQGFGLEIAQGFAANGGTVVLTDINIDGAKDAATTICDEHGVGRAIGLAINVTDEASVQACIDGVVREFGGFDVFVSNAGVLKAGSVKSLSERDFDFVTAVNYKGYFVCTKFASPVLATQHRAKTDYTSDIIQINSKSGLVGSNKNGAYAGGKFGGIGLTQSFALELVTDGIKVNSICPGNFFDGPLWSDPDRGLFVQYLNTGKVPGATSIADVKAFYEAKVPMKRGCTTPDVLRAIMYLIEQQYETGQALPVTGGQVMLS